MNVEDLLLTKEEIPVLYKPNFNRPYFEIPIHPALVREDVQIDSGIAQRMFPAAAAEYLPELAAYSAALLDGDQDKKWFSEVFLKPGLEVISKDGRQTFQQWVDLTLVDANGFASAFSINRNAGGTLQYNPDERPQYISPPRVNFSKEKFAAYRVGETFERVPGVRALVYGHHNIDFYPGALFLRNWALLTLNESIKQLGDKLFEEDKLNRMNWF